MESLLASLDPLKLLFSLTDQAKFSLSGFIGGIAWYLFILSADYITKFARFIIPIMLSSIIIFLLTIIKLDGYYSFTVSNIKHAFGLGCTLVFGLSLCILDYDISFKIWPVGLYISVLALFHWGEFFVVSLTFTKKLSISSYLIFNNQDYDNAFLMSIFEYCIESLIVDYFNLFSIPSIFHLFFFVICLLFDFIRKLAMLTAAGNFNHKVQFDKEPDHELVTSGIYSFSRHPAYFAWFYFSFFTQCLLANPICMICYPIITYRFFSERIKDEESALIGFFGRNYLEYQERVPIRIPFMTDCKRQSITIHTDLGDVKIELFVKQAPLASKKSLTTSSVMSHIKLFSCLQKAKRSALLAISPQNLPFLLSRFEKKCGPLESAYFWPGNSSQSSSLLVTMASSEHLQEFLNNEQNYPRINLKATFKKYPFMITLPPFRICSNPAIWNFNTHSSRYIDHSQTLTKLQEKLGTKFILQPKRLEGKKLEKVLHNCSSIDDQFVTLLEQLKMTEADQIARFIFTDSLEDIISRLRPDSRVIPFGSVVSGLGTPKSDVDMLVKLGSEPSPDLKKAYDLWIEQTHMDQDAKSKSILEGILTCEVRKRNHLLYFILKLLKKLDPLGVNHAALYHGRIPIIHIKRHGMMGIGLDISKFGSNEDLYVVQESATWQRKIVGFSPQILEVVILLKHLMRSVKVTNDGPGFVFTSTKIISLFFHFLQIHGYIPPIKYLIIPKSSHMDQPDAQNIDQPSVLPETLQLAPLPGNVQLLEQFLDYLPSLQPWNSVISLLEGKIITRSERDLYHTRSETFVSHIGAKKPPCEHFLYIPDPIRPNLNITHHINEHDWAHFLCLTRKLSNVIKFNSNPISTKDKKSLWGLPAMERIEPELDFIKSRGKAKIDLLVTEEQIRNSEAS